MPVHSSDEIIVQRWAMPSRAQANLVVARSARKFLTAEPFLCAPTEYRDCTNHEGLNHP